MQLSIQPLILARKIVLGIQTVLVTHYPSPFVPNKQNLDFGLGGSALPHCLSRRLAMSTVMANKTQAQGVGKSLYFPDMGSYFSHTPPLSPSSFFLLRRG